MKLPFLAIALAIGFAALSACSSHQSEVVLRDFDWSLVGDTAPFSFELENATVKNVDAVVFVVAGSRRESKTGTHVSDIGREKIEVSLGPKEKKRIVGLVHLASTGDIALQAFISVKGPNQTPEPTSLLVTPRAFARVAPSSAVAHL